jgi:hypothetical protein
LNADPASLSTAEALERDYSINLRIESVVATDADIFTGVESRPPLANEDAPRRDPLAGEALYTQPLANTVSAVS